MKTKDWLINNLFRILIIILFIAGLIVQIAKIAKVNKNIKDEDFYRRLQKDNNLKIRQLQEDVAIIAEQFDEPEPETETETEHKTVITNIKK